MTSEILESENQEHGFWGTTRINYDEEKTKQRWNIAFETLTLLSGKPPEAIREFLDSRIGRHIADDCFDKDIKQVIMQNYYAWYEAHLFGDSGKYMTEKDKSLFGSKVLNQITGETDVLLYTYKNPDRIYQDYAMYINQDEKIYFIGLRFINIMN